MLGFSLGDLGFDLKGLDATAFDEPDDGIESAVWRRPIAPAPKVVAFEHAREMAREMVLDNKHETFAFVSGNFVFGDLLEALVEQRRLSVRSLGIHTLSLNRENIDGIRNILEMQPVERLDVILSNYWYAHELNTGLVGYLFDELEPRPAGAARGVRRHALQGRDRRDAARQRAHHARERQPPELRQHRAAAHQSRPRALRVLRGDEPAHPRRLRRDERGQPEAPQDREEGSAMASTDYRKYKRNDERGSRRKSEPSAKERRRKQPKPSNRASYDIYGDEIPF